MPAERMADGAKAARRIHLRQRLQQIQRACVVINRLHGAAHVLKLAKIRPIIGKMRVRRRDGHIPAAGQLRRIRTPFTAAQAHDHLVSHAIVRGHQAQHGRRFAFFQNRLGNAQVRRRA